MRGRPSSRDGRTRLSVQGLGELVDRGGYLQAFVEDGTLPLQADVARPFHKARQVTLRLDILACTKPMKTVTRQARIAESFSYKSSTSAHQRSWWEDCLQWW